MTMITIFSIAWICLFSGTALAYIDPGTGNYLLQIIIAIIAGSLFAVKLLGKRIKNFWQKLRKRKSAENE